MSKRVLWIAIAGVGVLSLVGFLVIVQVTSPRSYLRELSEFTLTSQTGDEISLSDFRGDVVLMAFGYTHCPDVCPLTLAQFNIVARALADDVSEEVSFVFVSVDPYRDSPERLGGYLAAFNPDFIGMTGDEAYLREVGEDYGLYFEYEENPNTQAEYLVAHTASMFLIDPEGRLSKIYPYLTSPDVMQSDIEAMVAEFR